ncbi:MAG: DUF1924 domain-containing protein [Gammaproteobacteria bacterium]|nr:DUF1924 domain-containing protein [Gammaproteobacteria bacterium]
MNIFKKVILLSLTIIAGMPVFTVGASEVNDLLLKEYQLATNIPFSAQQGERLWTVVSNERSCTTCHSTSVNNEGKHNRTGKRIKPMSPTVNPERLADAKKIKKWLLRNCKWTFGRECTVQEKGNILLWLSQQ